MAGSEPKSQRAKAFAGWPEVVGRRESPSGEPVAAQARPLECRSTVARMDSATSDDCAHMSDPGRIGMKESAVGRVGLRRAWTSAYLSLLSAPRLPTLLSGTAAVPGRHDSPRQAHPGFTLITNPPSSFRNEDRFYTCAPSKSARCPLPAARVLAEPAGCGNLPVHGRTGGEGVFPVVECGGERPARTVR